MKKSFRGKYWHCNNCGEFPPVELTVCECGHPRYPDSTRNNRNKVFPSIFVSKIPPGLRGDKMYIYRQNGKQLMDKMQAKQGEKELQKVKERIDRTSHGPGSLEHYRGQSGK